MLTFYYSKGSSAVAAHILLHEVAAPHEAVEVSIPEGAHLSPDMLRRNPKGRIPFLETPEGVITENPAILEYIAASFPQAGCVPKGVFQQAQARALAAYLCGTAHVAFAHKHRGQRWARSDAAVQDMQSKVADNLIACAVLLEQDAVTGPWALGKDYSFCDPYLFQFTRWLAGAHVSIDAYPRLAAHRKAMLARPATKQVLALHGVAVDQITLPT